MHTQHRFRSDTRARHRALWLAPLLLAAAWAGAAVAEDSEARRPTLNQIFGIAPAKLPDIALRRDVAPRPELVQALKRVQALDATVQVTWFRGHVDSFAAVPRTTIPDYARGVLAQAGVVAEPRAPKKFGTLLTPKPALDFDRMAQVALPFETELRSLETGEPQAEDAPEGAYEGKALDLVRPVRAPTRPVRDPLPANAGALAHEVLLAFLARHQELFELSQADLGKGMPGLEPVRFGAGPYYLRLVYQQSVAGLVLHSGKTIVLLDRNWNVIDISRMLLTEAKLRDLTVPERGPELGQAAAVERAYAAVQKAFGSATRPKVTEATLGFEAVRGIASWRIRFANANAYYADIVLNLDAVTGELLNAADNLDRHTDAKVSRWGYSSGDLTVPIRYTAENFYTRDDDTLVHDFFHVVTDNRNNGDPLDTCSATPQSTDTESAAYGTTSGTNYIRPTIRSDRDFSLWWPAEVSGTFGEAHAYYWSRWFMQWLKGALGDLGVLPSSAGSYPRALIILNACEDGVGVHSSSFAVTTLHSVGEGINTIRLPERCRSGNGDCASGDYASSNSDHSYTFEGNGGYSVPGVMHHELNHYVMKRYFDIGSGLDCNASEQLKFLHEGALGRSLPQAYWHNYYGTGYAPSNTNRNYRHNATAGRPHKDTASLNTLSDFLCADDPSPYSAGSVVHQAMWKFYHGIAVNGSAQSGIPRTATDRDFLLLYYWAADLVSASTYQDRYEMANRVMEIMENHSTLSSTGKQQWCDVWEVHELDDFIASGYCN